MVTGDFVDRDWCAVCATDAAFFLLGQSREGKCPIRPVDAEIKAARRFIHIQAGLILILLLLAVLMARGVGVTR